VAKGPVLAADYGHSSKFWERSRRGKKVGQAFPVSRLRMNLYGPGAAQRMCSRCLCDCNSLLVRRGFAIQKR
jgi:hypothetical protein